MIIVYTRTRHAVALADVFSPKQAGRFFREDDNCVVWKGRARDRSKKYVQVYGGGDRVYVIDRPCNLMASTGAIIDKEYWIAREARKQARWFRKIARWVKRLMER